MNRFGISRKEFLRLSGVALGGLLLPGWQTRQASASDSAAGLIRIATEKIGIYSKPSYDSSSTGYLTRDQLVYYDEELVSSYGPDFNPRWYKLKSGYIHTAYTQKVDTVLHETVWNIPEEGLLFEATVPITQTFTYNPYILSWDPLYRLYYQSVHRVIGVEQGPDQRAWYRIFDDLQIEYMARADHFRQVMDDELTPLASHISPEEKYVEVSITDQTLKAYQGTELVLDTLVSTGIPGIGDPGGPPSYTPKGTFFVQVKMPNKHMGNGELTAQVGAYELPGVPYVSFFDPTGVAFHGTYWHDNYGQDMSHGCVNMAPEEARWIYRWVTPEIQPGQFEVRGQGTRILVF